MKKIFRETVAPKSLKTRYEAINNVKLDKNKTVVELDDGSLVLVDFKKKKQPKQTQTTYVLMKKKTLFLETPHCV